MEPFHQKEDAEQRILDWIGNTATYNPGTYSWESNAGTTIHAIGESPKHYTEGDELNFVDDGKLHVEVEYELTEEGEPELLSTTYWVTNIRHLDNGRSAGIQFEDADRFDRDLVPDLIRKLYATA